jgi:hypothetical protein
MPPISPQHKIRSLRERAGKGTPPWTADLEHDVLFLGLESMSGYAAEVRRIVVDDDLRVSTRLAPLPTLCASKVASLDASSPPVPNPATFLSNDSIC